MPRPEEVSAHGRNRAGNEERVIIEPIDPRIEVPGGVDTCIRGLVKYGGDRTRFSIIGVDSVGDLELGRWTRVDMGGRGIDFLPIAAAQPSRSHPRIPHVFRMLIGMVRWKPRIDGAIIQCHRPFMGYLMRRILRRKRHIQFIHNDGVENLQRGSESYFTRLKWFYRHLERRAVRECEDVVVFNESAAARLATYGPGVRFSPTWFDDEYIRSARIGAVRDESQILWVGRIDPSKDPELAVRVLSNLPRPLHLTMVGGGSLVESTRRLASELGVSERLQLTGAVAKVEVAQLMARSGSFLMTSRYEGFPRVVVEALGSGLPVATTSSGEPNGLVVEGLNGARSNSRDPIELADAVLRSLSVNRSAASESVGELRGSKVVSRVLCLEESS